MLLILSLTVLSLGHLAASEEICFPVVGCFNNDPPFDNALEALPESPDKIGTSFLLYTRENLTEPQNLFYNDKLMMNQKSHFDAKKRTVFIIHGFLNSVNKTKWIHEMTSTFLEVMDINVIEVDWHKGAAPPFYEQCVANTRLVATEIQLLIKELQSLDLEDVHLVGHSLGAHIAGYVGSLLGSEIGRISALDPAGPLFESYPARVRLDASDAKFVDVIHSDGKNLSGDGGFGMQLACGHVDFYPNGGAVQPGCENDGWSGIFKGFWDYISHIKKDSLGEDIGDAAGCSHGRSHDIFKESITSSCQFTAYQCNSYEDFLEGRCEDCPEKGCNIAGYHASPSKANGDNYFITHSKEPLCGKLYELKVILLGDFLVDMTGKINAIVFGDDQSSSNGTTTFDLKSSESVKLFVSADLGQVPSVSVEYQSDDIFHSIKVGQIIVKDIADGKEFMADLKDAQQEFTAGLSKLVGLVTAS